ncbi:hypothetical protein EJ03DRAFT_373576 [Teratosphaeria nubilosa]|uniref:Uncharacterized protein n=1 Tax=Teratosphaeria nubilosa TaxID=161662 RepID=A0A6G1LDL4_9PEZI|nr:hypothetical protein EJ03DRAFT_373576 [Teratosphaeria nubilosa]
MADQQSLEIICISCQTLQEAGTEQFKSIAPSTWMCRECIVNGLLPRFHAALRYEHQYPVKVDFIRRFERKEAEYHTPVRDRVYCTAHIKESKHVEGAALKGEAIALTPEQAEAARAAGEAVRVCGAMVCDRNTTSASEMPCYHCGSVTTIPRQAAAQNEEDQAIFQHLVRGRDYNYELDEDEDELWFGEVD